MDSQPADVPPGSGESSRLRGLVQAILQYFEARTRLFQIEAEEAGLKLAKVAFLAAITMAFLGGAWLLLMPAAVLLLARWLEVPWEKAAAGVGGAHLALGILFTIALRIAFAKLRLFDESIKQFHKDREWIGGDPAKPS